MTNEEAFEQKFPVPLGVKFNTDGEYIFVGGAHHGDTCESYNNLWIGWNTAIAYMQELSEPVAWVSPKTAEYFGVEARYKAGVFRYGKFDDSIIPLFTTPQRQHPLKRLSEDKINEIWGKREHSTSIAAFANAIMDAMQELNK